RLVFDLRENTPYRIMPGEDPSTILVDFPEVHQLPSKDVWHFRQPFIQEVRFIESPTKITAQIRLTQPSDVHKHFSIGAPPRIVIDLTPQTVAASARPVTPLPATPQAQKTTELTPARQPSSPAGQSTPPRPEPPPAGKQASTLRSALLTPTAAEKPLGQTQLLQLAESQWKGKLLEDAKRSYRAFLERFPDYANNHLIAVRLADILHEQHHYQDALEAYAKILETYPDSEGAMISQIRMAELGVQIPGLIPPGQGEAYASYYHPQQALEQLIQNRPASPLADIARYKKGLILLQGDALPAALDIFRELLGKSLKDPLRGDVETEFHKTLERLLVKHQEQGAYLDVLRIFFASKGLLAPTQAGAAELVLPVALSYARLGLLPEAEQLLQRLLAEASTPQQRAVLAFEQATLLFKQGKLQEATTLLVPLVQSNETRRRGQILLLAGQIALQDSRLAEAVRYLGLAQEFVDSPANRAFALHLLGAAYIAQGDKARGLQALQKCAEVTIEDVPGHPPSVESCLLRAGGLLAESQQFQPALSTYQALLQIFPQTSHRNRILLHMAGLYRELADASQMTSTLVTLRDTANSALWQKAATDSLDDAAWQKRFPELLAEFQNHLSR
ncbi:MAG TPA: tetratricopeptide repeat protein, partial [Candidatus Tectomicrobia bacterium]